MKSLGGIASSSAGDNRAPAGECLAAARCRWSPGSCHRGVRRHPLLPARCQERSGAGEHLAEEVLRGAPRLEREDLVEELDVAHTAEPEEAEVASQLAPCAREPDRTVEEERQRPYRPLRLGALLVAVAEADLVSRADRG